MSRLPARARACAHFALPQPPLVDQGRKAPRVKSRAALYPRRTRPRTAGVRAWGLSRAALPRAARTGAVGAEGTWSAQRLSKLAIAVLVCALLHECLLPLCFIIYLSRGVSALKTNC